MIDGFDPGALLARSYRLPRGPRVCLRLARIRDRAAIAELLDKRQGGPVDEVDLGRLVRADPRRQLVICATALIGGAETLVGLGAIELSPSSGLGHATAPSLLVCDESLAPGLQGLLSGALTGRALALRQARAA